MAIPSSFLFLPGTRTDRVPKAVASGAGAVCLDLEDAVLPADKDEARGAVMALLADPACPPNLVVRINHPESGAGQADVGELVAAESATPLFAIMVPKTGAAAEVEDLRGRLGPRFETVPLIPVVETARGLAHVEEIAATDGVVAMIFGGLDLSVELGCTLDWESLLYARSRCVHAARLAGVDLIDTPFFDVEDVEGLRAAADRAQRLGFDAMAAIHPRQVATIRAVFEPTGEDVDRARRIVEAFEAGGRGAMLVDGVMIDRPAVQAARTIIARHEASTSA